MIVDSAIRSISCDGPGCDKSLLFDRKDEKATFDNPDNNWLKAARAVQVLLTGQTYIFCSDQCELKSVAAGKHNVPEPSKIVPGTNPTAIAMAAQAAANAQKQEQALRDGKPAQVKLT